MKYIDGISFDVFIRWCIEMTNERLTIQKAAKNMCCIIPQIII